MQPLSPGDPLDEHRLRPVIRGQVKWEDFSPFPYPRPAYREVLAVGWNGTRSDFSRGKVPLGVITRILDDLESAGYQPSETQQKISCHSCRTGGTPLSAPTRFGVIWVPAWTRVFVAPGNLVHWLYDHDYLPPREFLDAVVASPRVGSYAYVDASAVAIGPEPEKSWTQLAESARSDATANARQRLRQQTCPYCLTRLRTAEAHQCLCCGLDWHVTGRILRAGLPVDDSGVLDLFRDQPDT